MMGKSHLVTGVTAASWTAVPLVAVGVPPVLALLSIPVGAYAALLPDIDHGSSTATWSLPPLSNLLSWVIRGCPVSISLPIIGWGRSGWLLPRALTVSTGHRKQTHTEEFAFAAGLVIGLPLWLLTSWWWVFALQITIGCLTHDWGDMRTVGGLRARNGQGRRNIGRTFETGSDYELWLRYAVYQPTAVVSAVGAFLTITYMGAT